MTDHVVDDGTDDERSKEKYGKSSNQPDKRCFNRALQQGLHLGVEGSGQDKRAHPGHQREGFPYKTPFQTDEGGNCNQGDNDPVNPDQRFH